MLRLNQVYWISSCSYLLEYDFEACVILNNLYKYLILDFESLVLIAYSFSLQFLPLADLHEYQLTVNIACEINVGLLQQ
jgi:hypothetical protein